MKQSCGCCTGIEVVTPQPEANRPGLPALAYRTGTYATFFESMVASLSNLYLDVPSSGDSNVLQRIYPLSKLTTRELRDPSIALLDAWAIVADVLTFYQQRIANEGYLLTATERLSVLELARLVGYKLRPGVSASVYLAFTVAPAFNGTIPAGTRAQSIPGTEETAQFFETSTDLTSRDTWNTLQPRLTRPQVITQSSDSGTDAATRDTLYFEGISTNLKIGEAILIVLGDGAGQQVLRYVDAVDVQTDQGRTEVTLRETPLQPTDTVNEALDPFIDQATSIFANSTLATTVAGILTDLEKNVAAAPDNKNAADIIRAAIPQVQEQHSIAAKRNFTRLEPWTADVVRILNDLVALISGAGSESHSLSLPLPIESKLAPSALGNLTAIVDRLALPPSLQPANPQRLVRSVQQTFSPQADIAPRLLAAFNPAAAPNIYQAWSGVETPFSDVEVAAMRAKTAFFAGNSLGLPQYTNNQLTGYSSVSIESTWGSLVPTSDGVVSGIPSAVALDAAYDQIRAGSWVVIDRPIVDTSGVATGDRIVTQHQVIDLRTVTMAATSIHGVVTGYSGKSTQLTLSPPWLNDASSPSDRNTALTSEDLLRGTVVYAQPEYLDLAEEPLDTDVEGNTIELAQLYDGFESGRWIIVSGQRTDIANTTGVTASELVMISAVTQGSNAPLCAKFPANYVPLSKVYYTTDANGQGDRLVVGELAGDADGLTQLSRMIPSPNVPNQQFCDQVQLGPGLYVNAYVPAVEERKGVFSDFQGLLVDPTTNVPYSNGVIPGMVLGTVFAWRISTAPVHTILTLANNLAYSYDSTSVAIYGNVVQATHGQTVGEILGDGDGSQAFQQFALHQSPLTYVSASTPEGTQSTLVVRVNDIEWDEANDLASLSSNDREYITQTDDSDVTSVIFGNGQHGARVPSGSANIKAVYRYGIGAAGNVQAQQISQLATHPQGAQGVINPLAASGGADRDSIDQARRNTPVALLALDRLVSVSDYAAFARTFAGTGKTSAARLTDGRRQVVHVTIAGAQDIPIDPTSNLYRNLVQALYRYGDPYQPIQVAVRKLNLLVISARVKILAAYQWESVEANVRAALLAAFSFDQRDLGQSAFLSEAIAVVQAVEGVSYVDFQTFDSVAEDSTAAQLAGLANTLALRNFVEADLARVDPTATDPSKRILPAGLIVLTPAIPDTLILTEITG